ncbi:hypothetical protein FRC02_001955 [Tulasnella sp. 418]|nr:hypothetical protein FRC02_001955 [Tulasnella sp. 418]
MNSLHWLQDFDIYPRDLVTLLCSQWLIKPIAEIGDHIFTIPSEDIDQHIYDFLLLLEDQLPVAEWGRVMPSVPVHLFHLLVTGLALKNLRCREVVELPPAGLPGQPI